ncbi:hypothetical protein HYW19_03815 [Candidatus Woesearchaeota archaeon]|nr:hypothetical protein [Candidatus Woesearchaeota archaeon]
MASILKVPIKYFQDGEPWLLLDSVLSKRVIFRAHEIDIKGSVKDFDPHHCMEAHARGSVKCKAKSWDISDKIVTT